MTPTIEALLRVHPEIQKRLHAAQVVEDVMNRKITGGIGNPNPPGVVWKESAGGKGENSPSGNFGSKYIPKGTLEDADDYKRRLMMTPYFPETPHIIQDRIGAIFAEAPEIDGELKEEFNDFQQSATRERESLTVAAASSAVWLQRIGFQGCLIDRKRLDSETQQKIADGSFSQADADAQKIGEPYACFYRPNQILDFETDDNGLVWVKVVEFYTERADWSGELKAVQIVRIIDRMNITSWKIDSEKKVTQESIIPHEHKDENNKPEVPFVFLSSPVDAWSALGGSMLIETAESDVSCTRLLSDIIYCLYILGQPILCWITMDEKGMLPTGAGRYVKLKPASGTRDGEDLKFAQLDPAGIDLQIGMHDRIKALGRTLAGRAGDAVITDQPKETSGVSRAWEFKTGEERVLFLITSALQSGYEKILRIVALMKGLDATKIKIKFNTKFDLGAPKDALDVSERVFNIVSGLNMPESKKVALRKILDSLGPRTEEEDEAIDEEIEEAGNQEVQIADPNNVDQGAGGTVNGNGSVPPQNKADLQQKGMAQRKRIPNKGNLPA